MSNPTPYNPTTGAYIVPSLNKGSNTRYVLAQMTVMDGGIHIQVRCPIHGKKNRPYGMAIDIPFAKLNPTLAQQMVAWFKDMLSSTTVEAPTDENEFAKIVNALSKGKSCGQCGKKLCNCGHCHSCEDLDGSGNPNDGSKPVPVEGVPEAKKCPECLQDVCPGCGMCHACKGWEPIGDDGVCQYIAAVNALVKMEKEIAESLPKEIAESLPKQIKKTAVKSLFSASSIFKTGLTVELEASEEDSLDAKKCLICGDYLCGTCNECHQDHEE